MEKHYIDNNETAGGIVGLKRNRGEDENASDGHESKRPTKVTSIDSVGTQQDCHSPGNLSVLHSAASLLALGGAIPTSSIRQDVNHGVLRRETMPPKSRASKDQEGLDDSLGVGKPSSKDVLCGRGRGYFCHRGNRRMLEIVEKNKPRYRAAQKSRKTEIVREVTDEIQGGGSRFLKKGLGMIAAWFEVTASDKHKKVCHCLREEKNNIDTRSIDSLESAKQSRRKAKDIVARSRDDDGSDSNSSTDEATLKEKTEYSRSAAESKTRSYVRVDDVVSSGAISRPGNASTLLRNSVASSPQVRNELDILGMAAAMQLKNDTPDEPSTAKRGTHMQALAEEEIWFRRDATNHSARGLELAPLYGQLPVRDQELLSAMTVQGQVARGQLGGFHRGAAQHPGIVYGEPRAADVLFAQDQTFYSHQGNVHLRNLIQGHVGYPQSTHERKVLITQSIGNEMKLAGGRFLTRERNSPSGVWYHIKPIEADTLIYQCLEEEEIKMNAVLEARGQAINPYQFARATENGMQNSGSAATTIQAATRMDAVEQQERSRMAVAYVNPTAKSKKLPNHVEGGAASDSGTSNDEDKGLAPTSPSSSSGPGPKDVICGRGRGNFRHPGNRRMLKMFWDMKARYNAGTKPQKTMIGREIVHDITDNGGRFLKRFENGWETVSEKVALRKVCHGIRDIPNDPEKRKRSVVAKELEATSLQRGEPWDNLPISKKSKSEEDCPDIPLISLKRTQPFALPDRKYSPSPAKPFAPTNGQMSGFRPPVAPLLSHNFPQNFPGSHPKPVPGPANEGTDRASVRSGASPGDLVEEPTQEDILCGRGRGNFGHSGNRRMLRIISQNTGLYKGATKAGKGQVARDLLAEVQNDGGRFLKRVEGKDDTWEVCLFDESLQKICHGIRDTISNIEGKKKKLKYREVSIPSNQNDKKGDTIAPSTPRAELGDKEFGSSGDAEAASLSQTSLLEQHRLRVEEESARAMAIARMAGARSHFAQADLLGKAPGAAAAGYDAYLMGNPRGVASSTAGAGGSLSSIQIMLAAQRHRSASAKLTPEEQMMLLQDQSVGLTPTELMMLREREHQLYRFL